MAKRTRKTARKSCKVIRIKGKGTRCMCKGKFRKASSCKRSK